MLKPLIVCKDYRVFREIVCPMYGFHPQSVNWVSGIHDIEGRNRITPVFLYLSAGIPKWYRPGEIRKIFENVFDLPEINPACN